MITENSKILAEYLGWKYVPNNDLKDFPKAGWYKKSLPKIGNSQYYDYICRNHNQLRFYNSMDLLLKVLNKITKENLSEYMYSWYMKDELQYNFINIDYDISSSNGCDIYINLELDPSLYIGEANTGDIIKDTFNACVQAIKYINEQKISRINSKNNASF